MIEKVQLALDNFFYDLEPRVLVSYQILKPLSSNPNPSEYITFLIVTDLPKDYGDNEEVLGEADIIVNYYTTTKSQKTLRKQQIKNAMELAGFTTIEKGSDLTADTEADLYGVGLEFRYATFGELA